MNEKNLKRGNPGTQFQSSREAAEKGKLGGIASGAAKRSKKSMASLARQIAESPVENKKKRQTLERLGVEEDDMTNHAVIVGSLYKQAEKGNVAAIEKWEALADQIAEDDRPYELPARVIGKAFSDINREIVPNVTYIFRGGRGSLKSTFVSEKIIEIIKNNPMMHVCCLRQVAKTLKDSVYAQFKWTIRELGLEEEFEYTKSPLEIVYKKTGQKIYFRGADEPGKIKSIKTEFGYIGVLWIEERDQLNGPDAERSIKQSVLRGGENAYFFASFNPPRSAAAWVNKDILIPDKNRVVHSSSYLEAPAAWLGRTFIDDAEHLKEVNPAAYEHEYLGTANGTGGQVFDFLEIRPIKDAEIDHFDRIYQGVDWGWYPDIYAFVRLHYDAARETIYIFAEHTCNKESNRQTAAWILEHEYTDYRVTCDSAEKKSVADYKAEGIPAAAAVKGPGSVEYSFKWLACRKIVIDPERCPVAAKEFTEYEYERDKDGNVISGYPDHDNHVIDAVRYATEPLWQRKGSSA